MPRSKSIKIQGIVYSFDRAMQLDAVLRSWYHHCRDAEKTRLTVLFKASDIFYANQYAVLVNEYPQVTFVDENNFRRDTLSILTSLGYNPFQQVWLQLVSYLINTECIRIPLIKTQINCLARIVQAKAFVKNAVQENSFILFLVDDALFVRDFWLNEVLQALHSDPEAIGFSLRLGRNTKYCYTLNSLQAPPSFVQVGTHLLVYPWKEAKLDFAYPLEISSSVYRAQMIIPLVATLRFHHPNKMEGRLAECNPILNKYYKNLICFDTSVAFCNPVNMVQKIVPNRAGKLFSYSVRNLAERFENGERIDIDTLDGFVPNGCHQEIGFLFQKKHG